MMNESGIPDIPKAPETQPTEHRASEIKVAIIGGVFLIIGAIIGGYCTINGANIARESNQVTLNQVKNKDSLDEASKYADKILDLYKGNFDRSNIFGQKYDVDPNKIEEAKRVQDRAQILTVIALQSVIPEHTHLIRQLISSTNLNDLGYCEGLLYHARFMGARLEGAHLAGLKFKGALFSGAILSGADFTGADFRPQIDVDEANKEEKESKEDCSCKDTGSGDCKRRTTEMGLPSITSFQGAILIGTNFNGARFDNPPNLVTTFAGIKSVNFDGADISHATFDGTDISGVDFSGAKNLECSQFKGAKARSDYPPKFPDNKDCINLITRY